MLSAELSVVLDVLCRQSETNLSSESGKSHQTAFHIKLQTVNQITEWKYEYKASLKLDYLEQYESEALLTPSDASNRLRKYFVRKINLAGFIILLLLVVLFMYIKEKFWSIRTNKTNELDYY